MEARMGESWLISGGRVRVPDGLADRDLCTVGPTIASAGAGRVGSVMDAAGLIVAPGFIDLQINGAFGYDFTDDPDSIWEVGGRLPQFGVTAFLPTIISSPASQRSRAVEVVQSGPPSGYRGAEVLGLHFEGPMLSPLRRGTHREADLRLPAPELIRGWSREVGIRLVTLAPELPGAHEITQALLDCGIVVAAGHTAATYDEGVAALGSGIFLGTHLFNGMRPFAAREPGLATALLEDDRASVGVIADGVHLHPAVVSLVRRAKSPGRVVLVTDAMAGAAAGPGEYRLAGMRIRVDETSARNEEGGLAGSLLTMDRAVRNYLDFTRCSPAEALTAASEAPARVLDEDRKGVIEDGRDADLVFLDPQLRVMATMIGGSIVYERFPGRTTGR